MVYSLRSRAEWVSRVLEDTEDGGTCPFSSEQTFIMHKGSMRDGSLNVTKPIYLSHKHNTDEYNTVNL